MKFLGGGAVVVPPGRRHPSFDDVLLRRRWRAEHTFERLVLTRIGWLDGALMRWFSGDIRSLPPHAAMLLTLRLSLFVDVALAVPAAFGLLRVLPAGFLSPAAGVLVAALSGVVVGASSAQRIGLFPFEELRRLSPFDDAATSTLLTRIETRYLRHRRVIVWFPVPLAAFIAALRTGDAFNIALGVGALLVAGIVFSFSLVAGGRLAVIFARSRAVRRVGLRRWLAATALILLSGALGWLFAVLLAANGLRSVWSTMTSPTDLLDDGNWYDAAGVFLARLERDASGILTFGRALLENADAIVVVSAITLPLAFIGFSFLPALLIRSHSEESERRLGDAVDAWLSFLDGFADRRDGMMRVLVRRMRRQRWAIAQHFWTIIQPTPEAAFFLGGAVGLSTATANPWLTAAILAMSGTMAAHIQATTLHEELMPALGMSAERAHLPLLLGTSHGSGIAASVRARRQLLAVHLFPSAAVTLAFLLGVVSFGDFSPWSLAGVAAATALSYVVAPAVQWYMGAVLVPEAYAERDFEQGTGSSTETLHSRLQGIPRIFIVVLPCFALIPIVALGSAMSPTAGLAFLAALILLPLLALPLLNGFERQLSDRSSQHGLEAWRIR